MNGKVCQFNNTRTRIYSRIYYRWGKILVMEREREQGEYDPPEYWIDKGEFVICI